MTNDEILGLAVDSDALVKPHPMDASITLITFTLDELKEFVGGFRFIDEPVAWHYYQQGFWHYTDDKRDWYDAVGIEEVIPLYTRPAASKGRS